MPGEAELSPEEQARKDVDEIFARNGRQLQESIRAMIRSPDPSATPDPLEVEVVANTIWDDEDIGYALYQSDWDLTKEIAEKVIRALDTYRASKGADHGR